MATIPRGVRNNNPLNIRHGKSTWLGLRAKQTDNKFCQFISLTWGFRAAFRIMYVYYHNYNLRTINDIIGRWAPEHENNTEVYISVVLTSMVSYGCVVSKDEPLPAPERSMTTWCELVRGMYSVECGKKAASSPTALNDIVTGWKYAFL